MNVVRNLVQSLSTRTLRSAGDLKDAGLIGAIDTAPVDDIAKTLPIAITPHIAGIIGAIGNNQSGVVGVNWQAQIMSLRISSADDFSTSSKIAEALDYILLMKSNIDFSLETPMI